MLWFFVFQICTVLSLQLPLIPTNQGNGPLLQMSGPYCNCTSTAYTDDKCAHPVGTPATSQLPAGKCTNQGSAGSTKINSQCTIGWNYAAQDCTGKILNTAYANGKCNQVGNMSAWYTATCTRVNPMPPPPPPPPSGCQCQYLYWESDTNCSRSTRHAIKVYGGQCTRMNLPFDRTVSVEMGKMCSEFRAFNGSNCGGTTISGIHSINECVPFSNGASGLVSCLTN
eukprot:TRINITY_DN67776_c11_g1_i2.p1 TRINITY_DN67776_c11_g1~~TRINITY_DN67776_c11_g1_i2.p1  ORF type:complete len:226 (+),score=18.47 TRINITY_DN67776_c11_g1_i2:26-703(+)